jgi:hypothetical protein
VREENENEQKYKNTLNHEKYAVSKFFSLQLNITHQQQSTVPKPFL